MTDKNQEHGTFVLDITKILDGDAIVSLDVPQDQSFVSTLGLDKPDPLLEAVRPFVTGADISLSDAIDIVVRLLKEVLEHRYFDVWCNTSRAAWLSLEKEKNFREIEKTLEVARFCFGKIAEGMSIEALVEVMDKFGDRGIHLGDNIDPVTKTEEGADIHLIQVKLDNKAYWLHLYNATYN